jgi:hypothetical protein
MQVRKTTVLLVLSLFTACQSLIGGRVITQASFDHRCPEDRIEVVRHDTGWRSVEVNACGTLRRYQYVGGGKDAGGTFVEEASTATLP